MDKAQIDPSQLFLTGSALETLCHWSNTLKSFQQRLSPYFARQEAPVRRRFDNAIDLHLQQKPLFLTASKYWFTNCRITPH